MTFRGRPLRAGVVATGVAVLAGTQVGIGVLAVRNPQLAIFVSMLIIAVLAAMFSPLGVAALAFPATIATWRVGGGPLDLSYADAALVAAIVLALPYVPWRSKMLQSLLSAVGVYLVILAITILPNPSVRAVLELFHRVELVAGSFLVGSAIAAASKTRLALRMFVGAGIFLALGAISYSLTHGFEPAYPFGINKNAAGALLACALLVVFIAPDRVELSRSVTYPTQVIVFAGLVACQSRASAATVLLVVLVTALRRRGASVLLPVVGVAALAAMIWATRDSFTSQSENARFNSLNTRIATYDRSLDLWADQPIFGAGLRFWSDPDVLAAGEPHNVVVSALGESGLVGLVGLIVLLGMVLSILRRRPDSLGRLAMWVVVAQVINALADIYWVAGRGTIPWLIVGLAAGAALPQTAASASPDRDVVGDDRSHGSLALR